MDATRPRRTRMLNRWISLRALVLASVVFVRPAAAAEVFSAPERAQLRSYAVDTWRSMASMVQSSGLPADGLHRQPDGTWAAATYTSPTDIAAYLWDVLAAESLGIIQPDEAGLRISRTLTALESMERVDGF